MQQILNHPKEENTKKVIAFFGGVLTRFEIICSGLSWPHMWGLVTAIFIPVTPRRSPPRLTMFTKWETKIPVRWIHWCLIRTDRRVWFYGLTHSGEDKSNSKLRLIRGAQCVRWRLWHYFKTHLERTDNSCGICDISASSCCLIRKMGIEDMMWCALLLE